MKPNFITGTMDRRENYIRDETSISYKALKTPSNQSAYWHLFLRWKQTTGLNNIDTGLYCGGPTCCPGTLAAKKKSIYLYYYCIPVNIISSNQMMDESRQTKWNAQFWFSDSNISCMYTKHHYPILNKNELKMTF